METVEMNETETINFIRCLMLSNAEDMYILSEFLNDFEEEAGYCLPSFNHETVVDFLKSIPEIIEVISVEGNLYLKLVDWEEPDGWDSILTPDVKNKVKEEDDPSLSKSTAESESLGGDSTKDGVKKKRIRKRHRGKKNKEKPENMDKKKKPSELDALCARCASLEAELEHETCIDRCLSSVILDESDIPVINLRDHVKIGDIIEVTVPEVNNPHRFILHLRKYKTEMTKLMGRMLTFYNLYSGKYALENFRFQENGMCAVPYKTSPECKEWYRARIIDFGSQTSTVVLIDYGLMAEVSNQNLKYLDRFFGDFPVQAINGRLANIKPYTGKYWSEDCCKRLYNFVLEKDLMARVINMDSEKRWLSVVLSCPGSDVFINDALVKEKYPVPDCDFYEEESFSPVVYESNNPKGFIQPEDIGRTRRSRSDFGNSGEAKIKKKVPVPCEHRNKELKKMFGPEVIANEWRSNTE